MYRFVMDWRYYRTGQTVDLEKAGMGRGQIELLLERRIIVNATAETVAGYQAMTGEPMQTMVRKRGRPAGSKNKLRV